jgi:hypothetical protein
MAFQSAPNMVSIAIHGTNNGKQIANVLHAKFGSYPVQSDVDFVTNQVATAVIGAYEPLMSDNLLLTDIVGTGLTFVNDFQTVVSASASPGTASGNPLPANNSLVATLRSALTGRSARGRIYTFPTGSGNVSSSGGDLYTTGYASAVQTFWNSIMTAIDVGGWKMVICSRRTAGALRATAVGFDITTIEVRNDTADSQRRRLPRGH